jgi:hypothetical protein
MKDNATTITTGLSELKNDVYYLSNKYSKYNPEFFAHLAWQIDHIANKVSSTWHTNKALDLLNKHIAKMKSQNERQDVVLVFEKFVSCI